MAKMNLGCSLTWYGQSAFLMVTPGGKHVLFDPFLTGNPKAPAGVAIEKLDLLLLSHAHGDHVGDAIPLAKKFNCPVVCLNELAILLAEQGVANTVGMGKGGTAHAAGLAITMVHATHSSSLVVNGVRHYAGEPAGFVVTLENDKRVYFAGDTGPMMDMQIIGDLYAPDLAILPIGDHYTMGPREAAYAAGLIRAPWIVPMHYGTFGVLTGTPDMLRAELKKRGVVAEVVAPQPGETVS